MIDTCKLSVPSFEFSLRCKVSHKQDLKGIAFPPPTFSGSKLNLDLGGVDCAFFVRGDCGVLGGFLAWERGRGAGERGEGGGVSFSYGGFGGEYRPFSFPDEDVYGSCAGYSLGQLPYFVIRYFPYPLSNA